VRSVWRQEHWRSRYQELKPAWTPSVVIYEELVRERVRGDGAVLDIGCGHADPLAQIGSSARLVCGVDRDPRALSANATVGARVAADAERLPFTSGSFRVVVLAWVFEHLEHPRPVIREIHRVLEPGGSMVFITPNALNYNTWLIRGVPNAFHPYLTARLYGRSSADTHVTRYRLNTVRRIGSLLSEEGFERERLIVNGDPTYIAVNEPMFRFACFVERIHDISLLQRARVHLIGAYRKVV
jgi:ubiquinone/menaquinone biosynthesis C-methylase UbiE